MISVDIRSGFVEAMKQFIIHTFGCQMNVCDSERIADLLCAAGWSHASDEEHADLVIFNTCCVRGSAEERAINRLSIMKPWRRKKPGRILALCGCIAQKDGAELLEHYPFLDLVVGTRDFHMFPSLVEEVLLTGERKSYIDHIDSSMPEIEARRQPGGVSAFVTIMYGCNNFCSYCVVPFVRGREFSRSKEDIVSEVESLVAKGVRETILLGQNVNSYKDPVSGSDFPDLLSLVNDVPGIERIRYTTSHPKDASEKLVSAVSNLSHVCENFHLPVQSGSDAVLCRMNREYTRSDYLRLVNLIRREIPDAVITTDLLVGFPGETDEDFQETLDLCRDVQWDAAFTFLYSVRGGTAAARLPDDVPLEKKKARLAELICLQEKISARKNSLVKGRVAQVLVERQSRRHAHQLAGKEREGRNVVFPGDPALLGHIVNVKIIHTTPHTLIGELCNQPEFSPAENAGMTQNKL